MYTHYWLEMVGDTTIKTPTLPAKETSATMELKSIILGIGNDGFADRNVKTIKTVVNASEKMLVKFDWSYIKETPEEGESYYVLGLRKDPSNHKYYYFPTDRAGRCSDKNTVFAGYWDTLGDCAINALMTREPAKTALITTEEYYKKQKRIDKLATQLRELQTGA